MRSLFVGLVVLAICVVGVGFYRGWFAITSPSPAAGSNDINVNLATDTDKIKEDAETVKEKATELTDTATDAVTEPDDQPKVDGQENQEVPADGQPLNVDPNTVPSNRN